MGGELEGGWRQAKLVVMVQGERMVIAGAAVGEGELGCLGDVSQRGNQQGEIVFGCEQGGRERSPTWGPAGSQTWWRACTTFGSG